jgi:hypothetical protein
LRVIVVPLFWRAIVSQACRVTDDVCESKRKAAPRQVQRLAVDEVKQSGAGACRHGSLFESAVQVWPEAGIGPLIEFD